MKYRFEKYCKDYENIENYEKAKADNFKNWEVHHRLETHNSDGEKRLVDISAAELKALDMYFDRPASELIYMRKSEHRSLHQKGDSNTFYGKHHSEEAKRKMSEAAKINSKGENNPFYGKRHSDETKKKISEANKNISDETRNKMSAAKKGKHLSEEHRNKLSEAGINRYKRGEKNPMLGKHLSNETKRKLSDARKGKHWYNNGKENVVAERCPEGFVPGKLK